MPVIGESSYVVHAPASEILVVDDTPRSLMALEAALDGLGCNVTPARSGSEALRLLLERDFALILLDVKMPSMSGIETAKLIRKRERNRRVPIIFMTAFDRNDEEVLAAYRLGAADFLFKPISPEILRAKVSVVVDLQRRTAQVIRQAAELREHQRKAGEAALAAERRRMEQEVLRARLNEEHAHAELLAKHNRELEQARAELERTNRQLAEGDRRKDEFIAMLGHELRNPLASLSAGVDLFHETVRAHPELERVHQAMRRQTDLLTRLVDDLLDVARITSGKVELSRQPVTIDSVIRDALENSRPEIEERDHQFELEVTPGPMWVYGDPVRLTQVLSNVLINAARYTEPGGKITVSCEEAEGNARVRIRDTGIGMDQEMLDRVFDLFSQQRCGHGGLGIGLTLVKRLVDLHGGRVRAHSDGPGSGTEIEIWLPLTTAPAEREPAAPTASITKESSRPLRIVLIEDNDDIRELMQQLLGRWGHDVHQAANGGAGIELLTRAGADLALIDLGLPDMDGYEVARRICQQQGNSRPHMIAVSGFNRPSDREQSADAGFDEHLSKPVTAQELRRVIESVPARER